MTPSFFPKTENTKIPVLTFQLKEGESVLQQIKRPILKMGIETLYKNNDTISEPFEFSPFLVVFKLPENYKERNLKVVVLSPKKEEIYTAPIPKE